MDTHRWRYALAANSLEEGCLFDAELGVAACGDWCAGSRIEGAYVSGLAAASVLAGQPERFTSTQPRRHDRPASPGPAPAKHQQEPG